MKMLNNYIELNLQIMMNLQLHIDDNVDYNMYTKLIKQKKKFFSFRKMKYFNLRQSNFQQEQHELVI